METTFQMEVNKAQHLLENIRIVNILMDIKQEIEENNICVNCNGSEYEYHETQAIVKTCSEIMNIIDRKIKDGPEGLEDSLVYTKNPLN